MTQHLDRLKTLNEISREAIKKDFTMVDSKVIIRQTVDIFENKMVGTFKMKLGKHPDMHEYEH